MGLRQDVHVLVGSSFMQRFSGNFALIAPTARSLLWTQAAPRDQDPPAVAFNASRHSAGGVKVNTDLCAASKDMAFYRPIGRPSVVRRSSWTRATTSMSCR